MKLGKIEVDEQFWKQPRLSFVFLCPGVKLLDVDEILCFTGLYESYFSSYEFNGRSLITRIWNGKEFDFKFNFVSRRGRAWDSVFEKYEVGDIRAVTSHFVPNSKLLSYDAATISFYNDDICNMFSVSSDIILLPEENTFSYKVDYWFPVLFEAMGVLGIKWGVVNMVPSPVRFPYAHYAKHGDKFGSLITTPLIDTIATSRMEDRSRSEDPWEGEPFNLFWGNVISCDIFPDVQRFMDFLSEVLPLSDGSYRLSDDQKFLYLFLSSNVEDSLKPNKQYSSVYNSILDHLMNQGLIHPGLSGRS